ncbi:D-3-phosphoglycerate dehydrogenase [Mycena indigotica]|uniref:D-3-phosphoglycerate dehydrogenase n=1 Tax=Mycena indigotica TaxID=2126181 RepID=A0A8H6W8G2_9AGAR|nr:D-3-phosphoglycerate dehydrogenase [Mycena indigotica]KAF7306871.1 D-3-phosphoglycerate dehydrogenase [Mycena indigotica]
MPSSPIPIPGSPNERAVAISASPSFSSPQLGVKPLHPVESVDLRLLLLENISQEAVAAFRSQGFHVDHHAKAMTEEELIDILPSYHAIGIRSKTKITARVIKAATRLLVIGCFCIGTNQVDLPAAAQAGIPVFNSPFSNSRSVAELVMGELVALSRQLFERSYELRQGVWNKQSKGCWEVRGKTLGIVGYGHIGSQLSVLAEAFGMRVIFYDVLNIMALGSARQVDSLESLLSEADFVTLHVPELPETIKMISEPQLSLMKQGSYLINNSRGKVVDIPALIAAVESKHLAGAAIDVFPAEPGANGAPFDDQLNTWASVLRTLPNVILTPHIGGSTEEAQRLIGQEVSQALSRYLDYGSTIGAVNFPEVDLRALTAEQGNHIRVCHVHKNQPGVLRQVNEVLSPYNVEKQFSDSKGDVAYLMADIADVSLEDISQLRELISGTSANILTRFLA